MTNLEKLEGYIVSQGFYVGKLSLNILVENEFEGFSGRASETWEKRVTIEIKSTSTGKMGPKVPELCIRGDVYDTINDVAGKALKLLGI